MLAIQQEGDHYVVGMHGVQQVGIKKACVVCRAAVHDVCSHGDAIDMCSCVRVCVCVCWVRSVAG